MNNIEKILNTLMAITQIANQSKIDFNKKLDLILKEIIDCINSEKGSIMVLKGRKNLEVIASTNAELIGFQQSMDTDSPSAWVIKNKKILYSQGNLMKSEIATNEERYNKTAFIVAPILNNDKVIGVLNLTEKIGPDSFSPQEQDIILKITSHLISCIETNRLSQSLQESRKALKAKNLQLNNLEKIRTELFNMLIHDLKGPISEIMANIDILSYVVAKENLEYVEAAQTGCDTLFRMISDLLDIARLEEGSLKLVYENLRPDDLLKESVSRLHGLSKIKELQFIENFPKIKPKAVLQGDRSILLRVLQNLITNAIHHSHSKETIEVGFNYLLENEIEFFIKDNGPGIPLEMQQSIFDKFMQLNKKRDGRKYSTGLGLNFCKLAIETHGGKIFVESDGKKGSCFKFILKLIK